MENHFDEKIGNLLKTKKQNFDQEIFDFINEKIKKFETETGIQISSIEVCFYNEISGKSYLQSVHSSIDF